MESMPGMYTQTRLSKRGSVYYFRAMIPKDFQSHYGKKEIVYSLRTKDYREASRLVRLASAKLEAEFDTMRTKVNEQPQELTVLNEDSVQGICDLWKHQCLDGDVWYRSQGLTDDEHEQRQSDHLQTIVALREILAKGRLERIQPALNQFLHLIGVQFCGNADDQRKLAWSFLETVIDTHLAVMQRNRGEVVATPPAPLFRSGSNLQNHPSKTGAVNTGHTLRDCFDLWKNRRASRPEKTVMAYRAALDDFVAFAGTKAASSYEEESVYAYIDDVQKRSGQDPNTISKNIGFLRAIYNAAKKRFKLPENPFSQIEIPGIDDHKVKRLPLSAGDLKILFASSVFINGGQGRAGSGAAAYWLPILSLYTGARLEELGQLHTADVKEEKDIWYIEITDIIEDEAAKTAYPKRLKSPSARRKIPLHPRVVEAGFLQYVVQMQEQGSVNLFPLLSPDCKGDLTGTFSKWWTRYRRKIGIDSPLKTFHSFRHSFKDAMREAEIDVMVANRLMGHKDESMGGHYGLGHSLRVLDLAIKKIDYPGLKVPSYRTNLNPSVGVKGLR